MGFVNVENFLKNFINRYVHEELSIKKSYVMDISINKIF